MGHNLDLTTMIGAPISLKCDSCGHKVVTDFEEYDIDCGDPNPKPGTWELKVTCDNCEYENIWGIVLGAPSIYDPRCKECKEDKSVGEKTNMCLDCLDWKMSELNK